MSRCGPADRPVHRVRFRHEVARLQAEPAQHRENLPQLAVRSRPSRTGPPSGPVRVPTPGHLQTLQSAAAVAGIAYGPPCPALAGRGVGDAGGMDHQLFGPSPQRQRATAAEGQQDQRLAGKVSAYGRSRPSSSASRSCCARMMRHAHRVPGPNFSSRLGGPRDRVDGNQTLRTCQRCGAARWPRAAAAAAVPAVPLARHGLEPAGLRGQRPCHLRAG